MQADLYKNNVTERLLPLPSQSQHNTSDPSVSASYYDSPLYEPRSNFYEYNIETVNYTYYYNDVAYTSNYTTVVETRKPIDKTGPQYDKTNPILGMHPFKFYSMIVCLVSIVLFLLYGESTVTAARLLMNRKYKELDNGDITIEW